MNTNLFKLALERLQASDWEVFEQLCSQFLISEFEELRTMAHPSGDGGRDSEIFSPNGKPFIAAQYSIAENWKSKIRLTIKRISETFPEVRMLMYLSNHQIGGQADDLKKEILEKGVHLDIRDRNWFLERATTNAVREHAVNEIIDRIARPYLLGEGIIERPSSPLTSNEAKAALVYLGLQWQDDVTEKGLTKLSFDALVRAALRHTHQDKRMSRSQIYDSITRALPSADQSAVIHQVDKALARLTKRYIRHWKKEEEFCLMHEEHQRIVSRLAEYETEEQEFIDLLGGCCKKYLDETSGAEASDLKDLVSRVRRVLEVFLLRQGETFVSAVLTNNLNRLGAHELNDIVLDDIATRSPDSRISQHYPRLIPSIVQSVLSNVDTSTLTYLRRLANSYTLLSFLNETPDVQSATRKLFSYGTIWIDTTVLLPLIAEQLDESGDDSKRLAHVFTVAHDVGVGLRVTPGVLQEISSHMNNALSCSQYHLGAWRGRVPYLYHQFINSGRNPTEFRSWVSLFRGPERPEDDLAQYLSETFGIKRQDLSDEAKKVPDDLRWAADRLWTSAHEERRKKVQQGDDATTRMLIQHDIEMYLGVIALRQHEAVTELGYRHWLLTLDRNAWEIRDRLKEEFVDQTPPSPLLSLTYLISTMTFGPVRGKVGKRAELALPMMLDLEMSESMPHDVLELANKVRQENDGLPEYVIRRKVRDEIDRARRRKGGMGFGAIGSDEEETEHEDIVNRR